jgi:hypothetical protein
MWICLNDCFVSAVEHRGDKTKLVVRARRVAHLKALFGDGVKLEKSKRDKKGLPPDYVCRTIVTKKAFAKLISDEILNRITYSNFKDSVNDLELHNLYLRFWADHKRFQEEGRGR